MCQTTLHIYVLYRCLVSRVLFPLCQSVLWSLLCLRKSAAFCFTNESFICFLKILFPAFGSQQWVTSFCFTSIFQRLSFQRSALSTKLSTIYQKIFKHSSYFLKIRCYSWDLSRLINLCYKRYWEDFSLVNNFQNEKYV